MAMLRRVHPIAGIVGFVTILIFWTSTAASEMFGSVETITAVKRAILWGLLILVPALAIAGATGFKVAGASTDPRILKKKLRMPFIAGNGLLILVPAALYLAALASRGEFGSAFYGVQAIELGAGAINLMLMGLNIRDGLRLTGHFARR
jgi:hypothetical protein